MSGRYLRAFGILCAMASAQALAAPPPNGAAAGAVSPSPAAHALATELAETALPRDLLVDAALRGYDHGFSEELEKADTGDMEREFPGFMEKLRVRGRAELARLMAERIPLLHERSAAVYAAELGEEDMRSLLSFLRSPTGSKMLQEMASAPPADFAADDELTADEVSSNGLAVALHSIEQLTDSERAELKAFATSPAGRAFGRINSKTAPIVAELMNDTMAEFEKRIEPIAMELLAGYSSSGSN